LVRGRFGGCGSVHAFLYSRQVYPPILFSFPVFIQNMISSSILGFVIVGSLFWVLAGLSILVVLFIRERRKKKLW